MAATYGTMGEQSLARAFRRALDEGLFAYPLQDGRWRCKDYDIVITGAGPLDVECECADAVFRERVCKHAICVVFCRLYGLIPASPARGDGRSILPDCLEDCMVRLGCGSAAAAA